MDIREKVYKEIKDRGGIGYPENESVAERLSEADRKLLVQDMDQFYTTWFEIQELQEENFDEKRGELEYIQESSFEIVCQALALKGDPNIIPYFLKYIPVDGRKRANHQVVMEDYNEQNLERCITNLDYYGESYIPVLLAHIHELVPDKMFWARVFLRDMIWHGTRHSENNFSKSHPVFLNLERTEEEKFLKLLDYSMQCSLDEVKENSPEEANSFLKISYGFLENINLDSPYYLQLAYLRQQFLKLHVLD